MVRKAVFLDLDGTLANGVGTVPDSAREAVAQARANGHLVFLCTGRVRNELWPDILSVGFDGVIASSGGQLEIGGDAVPPPFMAVDDVRAVVDYFAGHGVDFYLNAGSGLYPSRDCWPRARTMLLGPLTDPDQIAQAEKTLAKFEAVTVMSDDLARPDVLKICFLDSGVPFHQIAAEFGDRFELTQAVVPQFGPDSGELTIPGITKLAAIQTVLDRFGVPIEDTVAYGDGMNDVPMIEYVHTGVAMGNALPEVRQAADQVTGTPDEDGLRTSFTSLGLI